MTQWPDKNVVFEALKRAYFNDLLLTGHEECGWRTLVEIAAVIPCPEFSHCLAPVLKLVDSKQAMMQGRRDDPDGPTFYRLTKQAAHGFVEGVTGSG